MHAIRNSSATWSIRKLVVTTEKVYSVVCDLLENVFLYCLEIYNTLQMPSIRCFPGLSQVRDSNTANGLFSVPGNSQRVTLSRARNLYLWLIAAFLLSYSDELTDVQSQ